MTSCAASWGPERGSELYAKRQTMIEPGFAHTKFNRRCDRFLRRGRSACRSEWRLIHATHNLLKLHNTPPPPSPAEDPSAAASGGPPAAMPNSPTTHHIAP